jgi:hypothetical protein
VSYPAGEQEVENIKTEALQRYYIDFFELCKLLLIDFSLRRAQRMFQLSDGGDLMVHTAGSVTIAELTAYGKMESKGSFSL